MENKLIAYFTGDVAARLFPLYQKHVNETGSNPDELDLLLVSEGPQQSAVAGRAQEVMFFIGFVAGHGEDGLTNCHAV